MNRKGDIVLLAVDGVEVPAVVTKLGDLNDDGSQTVALCSFWTPELHERKYEDCRLFDTVEDALEHATDLGGVFAYVRPEALETDEPVGLSDDD